MKPMVILVFLMLSDTIYSVAAPPADAGKTIFSSQCAGCHNVNKVVTGPALAGIDERRPMDWIIKFVHSSQTVIKGGDPYAVALYDKFNKIPMPDHPDLTTGDIEGIVGYIKSSAIAGSGSETAPFRPDKIHPAYLPLSLNRLNNWGFAGAYLILVFLLIGALLVLVKVKSIQRKMSGKG